MTYQYPDPNDTITGRTIPRYERDREGYWNESEQRVLAIVKTALAQGPTDGHMLDIGCGEGRLLPVFADLFQRITAIEPDPDRFVNAEKRIATLPCRQKIRVTNEPLNDFEGESYDFILCSHIIQHISTETFQPFVRKMAGLARPGGIIALTTTHSTRPDDVYTKSEMTGAEPVETEIAAQEFDTYTHGRMQVLPIRYFNAEKLISLCTDLGLRCLDYRVFHVEDECFEAKPDGVFIDDYVNSDPRRKESFGRDMLLIFQKPE